jgi:DNA-binding response OmpR family regulator
MRRKIMLVDDEASVRRSMALGLSQRGYDTEPCENGMSALKKLDSYVKNHIPLEAVVVDIRLPDIDGIKLVKIIKFKYPGVPIVLITGYADLYNSEEIHDLKVNAFLEKPFSPEQLTLQFEAIRQQAEAASIAETQEPQQAEAKSQSAYMLLRLEDDADFFETYRQLHYMENVLYCDATKGDYDIMMLVQSDSMADCRDFCDNKVKMVPGIKSVDFLEIGKPVLENSTAAIIQAAEEAMEQETPGAIKTRDMSNRVSSYLLMEVEREKLDAIFPTLQLDENVIFCDYTTGKYNLVVFITGSYFEEIDRFIHEKIVNMEGVLKIKEYPVINLFEM